MNIKLKFIIVIILLSSSSLNAQDITGRWYALHKLGEAYLRHNINILETGNGYSGNITTIDEEGDIPTPINDIIIKGDTVSMKFLDEGTFKGVIKDDYIDGIFNASQPFKLSRKAFEKPEILYEYLDFDFYNSSNYQKLRKDILIVANKYYKAVELSDVESLDQVLHNDYRYLHDLGGSTGTKQGALKQLDKGEYGRGHNAIPGTIKISPLSTYGAVLTHRVVYNDTRFSDGAVFESGTVDHIMEFVKTKAGWQLIRLYSIDHHPDFNGNPANREEIQLNAATLKEYLGTYEMSNDVDCVISTNGNVLTATLLSEADETVINLLAEDDSTFFIKSKRRDWVYKFHKNKDGMMKLTVLRNSSIYIQGERISN